MNAAEPQPPPQPGERRILDLVVEDLNQRAEAGRLKYHTYLLAHNGGDTLMATTPTP